MGEISTRRATKDDFEPVSALLAELGRLAVGRENRVRLEALFVRHLDADDTASLVAEQDGRIIGFLALQRLDRLSREAPQAWVPDLIVTPPARGRGAGRALLHAAFVEAKAWGCSTLRVEAPPGAEESDAFLRAHGMQESGRIFAIAL